MSVLVSAPTTQWPWLSRGQTYAACLVLALGLLSLAAVAEMTDECRDEPIYLTTDKGNLLTSEAGTFLVADQEQRRCRLAFRWR